MKRLHIQLHRGRPATTNTRGRTLTHATPDRVRVIVHPAWDCTDPAALDAAAADLTDAARWLRDQQRPAPAADPTAPTLFDAEATSTP